MRLAVGRLQAQRHERLIEIDECIARPDLYRARFNTVRGEPVSPVEAPRARVVGNDSELDNLYAARAGVRQEGCHDHIAQALAAGRLAHVHAPQQRLVPHSNG